MGEKSAASEQVANLGSQIWEQILAPSLLPYASYGTWGVVASVGASGLLIFGLYQLPENVRRNIGRVGGFGILPLAVMIGWAVVGAVIGVGTSVVQTAIKTFWSKVPGINWSNTLVDWLSTATWWIVAMMIVIAAIKHLISSGFSYVEKLIAFVKVIIVGPLTGDVTGAHIAVSFLILAGIVNRRELNEESFYVPTVLGCLFGLTQAGLALKELAASDKGAFLRKVHSVDPLTGEWDCPNVAEEVKEDPPGTWVRITGKLVPCGTKRNPKHAKGCQSVLCDWPGYWLFCECGHEKENGVFRKDPYAPIRCANCGKTHPGAPKSMPFHPPQLDQHHPSPDGASPAQTTVPAAAPAAPAAGPVQPATASPYNIDPLDQLPVGQVQCECGEWMASTAVFCTMCRKPVDAAARKTLARIQRRRGRP